MKNKEPKTESFFDQIASPFEPIIVVKPEYDTSNDILRFEYKKGNRQVFPAHKMASSFMFESECDDEAAMVHFMAKVIEKNGGTKNDLMHAIPFVLRMLKSKSKWAE